MLLPFSSLAGGAVSFEFRDGLVWVNAIAGGRPLHLLLDSGAGSNVLSLDAARRLGILLGQRESVGRVGADATAYRLARFDPQLGGASIAGDWLAMDLRSTSAACSRPIDGLIGQDFFRGRIVQIDFPARVIRLLDKAPVIAASAAIPLRRLNDVMCVPVAVNGAAARWARLDTGCDSALLWVGGVPKPRGAAKGVSVGLARAGGVDVLTSLQLGSQHIDGVRTELHASEIFPHEAGLLGNGVLSRFVMTVDGKDNRLLLQSPGGF